MNSYSQRKLSDQTCRNTVKSHGDKHIIFYVDDLVFLKKTDNLPLLTHLISPRLLNAEGVIAVTLARATVKFDCVEFTVDLTGTQNIRRFDVEIHELI